jgi:hypothetical protein
LGRAQGWNAQRDRLKEIVRRYLDQTIGVIMLAAGNARSPSYGRWRQDLSGTITQRLNLEHEIHHTVSKLCILGFEPLK